MTAVEFHDAILKELEKRSPCGAETPVCTVGDVVSIIRIAFEIHDRLLREQRDAQRVGQVRHDGFFR